MITFSLRDMLSRKMKKMQKSSGMLNHNTSIYISNKINHPEPMTKQLTPAKDNLPEPQTTLIKNSINSDLKTNVN